MSSARAINTMVDPREIDSGGNQAVERPRSEVAFTVELVWFKRGRVPSALICDLSPFSIHQECMISRAAVTKKADAAVERQHRLLMV